MQHSTHQSSQPNSIPAPLAALGASHGYQLEGDTARLNAMFAIHAPAAHDRSWSLQLWACSAAPGHASELNHENAWLVTEAALPPIGEIADDAEGFQVSGFATTPAGTADHVMVLALAAGRDGGFSEIHDFAVYPQLQSFPQPQLNGTVGYRIDGGQVVIEVGRVANPRQAGTTSGTLVLELWALDDVHSGGNFQGVPLAASTIGTLDGQHEYVDLSLAAPFTEPPAGSWNVVLMLREWTAFGFVTRDFANFPALFTVAPAEVETVEAAQPVVEVAPAKTAAAKPEPAAVPKAKAPGKSVKPGKPAKPSVSAPEAKAPGKSTKPAAPAKRSATAVEAKAVEKSDQPAAASVATPEAKTSEKSKVSAPPATPSAAASAADAAKESAIPVNSANKAALLAIKGMPAKVAEGIIEKRPFESLDELVSVKGMGQKLLDKLRSKLRL